MLWWLQQIPPAPSRPGPAGTIRAYVAGFALVAAIAALLAVGALVSGGYFLLPFTVLAGGLSYSTYAISGLGRDPAKRVRIDGVRITVRMRRTYLAAFAALTLSFTVFMLSGPVLGSQGPILTAISLVLALSCVVVLPDMLRMALGRHYVSFDADTIQVRSAAYHASVDWDDLAVVAVDIPVHLRPAITLVAKPGTSSLTWRRRRILVPLEPRHPTPDAFELNPFAFDEPWLLYAQLAALLPLDREGRERYLLAVGTDILTGHRPVPLEVGPHTRGRARRRT